MLNSIKSLIVVAAVAFGVLSAAGQAVAYENQIVTVEYSYGAANAVKILPIFKAELNSGDRSGYIVDFSEPLEIVRVGAESYDIHVQGNLPDYRPAGSSSRHDKPSYIDATFNIQVVTDHHGNLRVAGWKRSMNQR